MFRLRRIIVRATAPPTSPASMHSIEKSGIFHSGCGVVVVLVLVATPSQWITVT